MDGCRTCWRAFCALRWDAARPTQDYAELKQFLGDDFTDSFDSSWELVEQWNAEPRESADDIRRFYQEADAYVYNLTIWQAAGGRPDYVAQASAFLRDAGVASVVDLGAGVGTDSLEFAERGLEVTAVDYPTRASEFLQWRARHRGLELTFLDASVAGPNRGFDLLWAMDVLEHVLDPFVTCEPWLRSCRVFIFDTQTDDRSGGRHPFHFQHDYFKLGEDLARLGFTPVQGPNKLKIYRRN